MDQAWDTRCEKVFQDALLDSIDSEQLLLSVAIEHSLEQLRLDIDRGIAESITDEWQAEIKRNFARTVGCPRELHCL